VPAGGWTLDGLIRAVAGDIGAKTMRDRRLEIRRDAASLATTGLIVNGDRIQRVEQKRSSVEQKLGSVEQKRGASSKSAAAADTGSVT